MLRACSISWRKITTIKQILKHWMLKMMASTSVEAQLTEGSGRINADSSKAAFEAYKTCRSVKQISSIPRISSRRTLIASSLDLGSLE